MQKTHLPLFFSLLTVLSLLFLFQKSGAQERSDDLPASDLEVAVLAGGCFWCMEPPFESLPGVVSVVSGYTGGSLPSPTYEQVSAGGTGHLEAVQVTFHSRLISYDQLLKTFWLNIDPVDPDGQFCDRGSQYRSAIFFTSTEQEAVALKSKEKLKKKKALEGAIATEILPYRQFYKAEDYHQNYYQTHPWKYKYYRYRCGRDARLNELWGDKRDLKDAN